jgi:hypothetical protein
MLLSMEAPDDLSEWKTLSNIGSLDATYHLTLRSALEKGLEFEGKAAENYNNVVKKAEINDLSARSLSNSH